MFGGCAAHSSKTEEGETTAQNVDVSEFVGSEVMAETSRKHFKWELSQRFPYGGQHTGQEGDGPALGDVERMK